MSTRLLRPIALAGPLAVACVLAVPPAAAQNARGAIRVDSLLATAERAVVDGRPWEATRLLTPLVRIPVARSPEALRLAARAAAGWGGWATVVRLLDGEAWLDSGDGEGRALLARAHLERGELEPAIRDARLALANPRGSDPGERAVTLARALDRADSLEAAELFYRRAATLLPDVRDWLVLRAAGVAADSGRRRELFSELTNPVAQRRILWTEALARKRAGQLIEAAALYDSLGDRLAAIDLRLGTGDPALRRKARAALVALVDAGTSADDTRRAIEIFDREFEHPTALEALSLARGAAASGEAERAAKAFARAGRKRLTDRDRFTYGSVLARLGRYREARALFATVRTKPYRGEAAYQRARAALRSGQVDLALRELHGVARRHAADSDAAATALYLIGDLLLDRVGDDSARAVFRQAATRYPRTANGRRAAFQAALIAYLNQDYSTAALEFDALARGAPPGGEGLAGLYWAGRARAEVGDSVGAVERWRTVLTRGRDSYYAGLAARRLGVRGWSFDPPAPTDPVQVPAPLARARELTRLGLRLEAGFEIDAFLDAVGSGPDSIRLAARGLTRAGLYGRAMRLAFRARPEGGPEDRELAELLQPLPYREVLTTEADSAGVDPYLVAAVIRQESAFDAQARSVADARGLMQVLPSVGAAYAREMGLADWDPVLLYQPGVNLHFGIRHLGEGLNRFRRPEEALAAFNAGVDRVNRWRRLRGVTDDVEVFVERIPFVETRDYVRRVMRNFAVYRALYGADQT